MPKNAAPFSVPDALLSAFAINRYRIDNLPRVLGGQSHLMAKAARLRGS